MSIWEKATGLLKREENEVPEWLIFGPLLLFGTVALAALPSLRLDLLFASALGLYFSARWQLKGGASALILLAISSVLHHLVVPHDHLWHFGLELSTAVALFVTALAFEEKRGILSRMQAQIETKDAALLNLEQDFQAESEARQLAEVKSLEKITSLQKEIEEVLSDHASILILNDVLRRSSARALEEKKSADSQMALLKGESGRLERELARLRDPDGLIAQNRELFREINAIRIECEQGKMAEEILEKRMQEQMKRAVYAEDQIALIFSEKEILETKLARAERDLADISLEWQNLSKARDQDRHHRKLLEEVSLERKFLAERLAAAENEIAALRQAPVSNPEEIASLEERVKGLEKTEALYLQLKKQFEEKNKILHETRSQLFVADTALQALKLEREEREIENLPLADKIQDEVGDLADEVELYRKENEELFDLVTRLSLKDEQDPSKRKKKVKTQPDQTLLF